MKKMKLKSLFIAVLMMAVCFNMVKACPLIGQDDDDPFVLTSLDVFLSDGVGQYTNLRNGPGGKVIGKIPNSHIVRLDVGEPKNGWFRINDNSYYDFEYEGVTKLKDTKTGYWIHGSCLGFNTRNYANETLYLYAQPNENSKKIHAIKEETLLQPVDFKSNGWVKVKTTDDKHTGWIQVEWLCGNPVTNCC